MTVQHSLALAFFLGIKEGYSLSLGTRTQKFRYPDFEIRHSRILWPCLWVANWSELGVLYPFKHETLACRWRAMASRSTKVDADHTVCCSNTVFKVWTRMILCTRFLAFFFWLLGLLFILHGPVISPKLAAEVDCRRLRTFCWSTALIITNYESNKLLMFVLNYWLVTSYRW